MGPMTDPAGALVLFSGGQDSTVCLAWALDRYARVETVGFDYGQRHAVELKARATVQTQIVERFPHWAPRLGDDHVLDMRGFGAVAASALTADRAIEMTEKGLPSTFVPGRNLVFLAMRRRWPTGGGFRPWSAACAKQTSPAIRTAGATRWTPCRRP